MLRFLFLSILSHRHQRSEVQKSAHFFSFFLPKNMESSSAPVLIESKRVTKRPLIPSTSIEFIYDTYMHRRPKRRKIVPVSQRRWNPYVTHVVLEYPYVYESSLCRPSSLPYFYTTIFCYSEHQAVQEVFRIYQGAKPLKECILFVRAEEYGSMASVKRFTYSTK